MDRERLQVYGLAGAIAALLLVVAYQFAESALPDKIVIATGQEGGAYHYFADQYRQLAARQGIELAIEIRTTSGSVENLRLLQSGAEGVDLAFVQTGTGAEYAAGEIVSLASLYYEPLWVFYRGTGKVARLGDLRGKKMAIGPDGSGTRAVALQLLRDNGMAAEIAAAVPLGGRAAAASLQAGEIDVAFLIASAKAKTMKELLYSEEVRPMSFTRAEAYRSRYRHLSSVVLHQGMVDLERNIPDRDIVLLAPAATLVARTDFHPALTSLFLQLAEQVHGEGGLFERPGEFPAPSYLDFPLTEEAQRFFAHGPPFLQRYLPFWLAVLVERLKILLLPLITLSIPLFKIVPMLYRWRVRSRIYRWYGDLSAVEGQLHRPGAVEVDGEKLLRELDRIEEDVVQILVPLSHQDEVYNLRLHIKLVRDTIAQGAKSRNLREKE